MEEASRGLSGLHDAAGRATPRGRSGHQPGRVPGRVIWAAHGQVTLAGAIWRRVFECATARLRQWSGLHLHRISATFIVGGTFGWAWGCYKVAHRVDTQAGRVTDAVSAAGRGRVVYGQR